MKINQFKTPILVAALVGATGSTWGAIESETIDFNSEKPASLDGWIQKFDSSQGTLTGVQIVFNITTAPPQNGSESIDASINRADFTLNLSSFATGGDAGASTGGLTAGGGTTAGESEVFSVRNWSSYIGTGSAPFAISVAGSGLVSGGGVSPSLLFSSHIDLSGTIQVDYLYTPAVIANQSVVPEESQFPLFTAGAAGFFGLCGLVCRARRSRAS
jgi:hypothetical protein